MKRIVFSVVFCVVLLAGCKKGQVQSVYKPFVTGNISINTLETRDGVDDSSLSITFDIGSSYTFDKQIASKDAQNTPIPLSEIEGFEVLKIESGVEDESYSDKFFLQKSIEIGSHRATIYFKNTDKTQELKALNANLTIRVDKKCLKNTNSLEEEEQDDKDYLDLPSFVFKVVKHKGSCTLNNGAILIPKIYNGSERIYEIALNLKHNAFKDIEEGVDFTSFFTLPDSLKDKGITFTACIEGEGGGSGSVVVDDDDATIIEVDEDVRLAANDGDKRIFIAMKIPSTINQISDVSNGLDKLHFSLPMEYLKIEEELSCENEIIFVENEYRILFQLTPYDSDDNLDINGVVRESITPKKMKVNIQGTYLSKPLSKGTDLTGLFQIVLQSINAIMGKNRLVCKVAENAPKLAKDFIIEFTGIPDKAATMPLYGNTIFADVDVYIPDDSSVSVFGVNAGEPYSEDITIDYPKIRIRGDAEISDCIVKYGIDEAVEDLRYTIKLYDYNYEFDSETIAVDKDVTDNFITGLLEGLSAKVVSIDKSPSDCCEKIVVSINGIVKGGPVERGGHSNAQTLLFQFNAKSKHSSGEKKPFLTSTNEFATLRLKQPEMPETPDEGDFDTGDDD